MADHDASVKEWTSSHSLRHGPQRWLSTRRKQQHGRSSRDVVIEAIDAAQHHHDQLIRQSSMPISPYTAAAVSPSAATSSASHHPHPQPHPHAHDLHLHDSVMQPPASDIEEESVSDRSELDDSDASNFSTEQDDQHQHHGTHAGSAAQFRHTREDEMENEEDQAMHYYPEHELRRNVSAPATTLRRTRYNAAAAAPGVASTSYPPTAYYATSHVGAALHSSPLAFHGSSPNLAASFPSRSHLQYPLSASASMHSLPASYASPYAYRGEPVRTHARHPPPQLPYKSHSRGVSSSSLTTASSLPPIPSAATGASTAPKQDASSALQVSLPAAPSAAPPATSSATSSLLPRWYLILTAILKETDGRDKIAKVVQYGGRCLRNLMNLTPNIVWWLVFLWRCIRIGDWRKVIRSVKLIAFTPAETEHPIGSFASALRSNYTADTGILADRLKESPIFTGTLSRLETLTAALSSARRVIRVSKWTYTLPAWCKTFEEWRKQVAQGIEREMVKKFDENEEKPDEASTSVAPPSSTFHFSHPHPRHVWSRLPWLSSVELLDLSIAVATDMSDDLEWLSKYQFFPGALGYKCGRIAMVCWLSTVILDLCLTGRIIRHYHYQQSQLLLRIDEYKQSYESHSEVLRKYQVRRADREYKRFVDELQKNLPEKGKRDGYDVMNEEKVEETSEKNSSAASTASASSRTSPPSSVDPPSTFAPTAQTNTLSIPIQSTSTGSGGVMSNSAMSTSSWSMLAEQVLADGLDGSSIPSGPSSSSSASSTTSDKERHEVEATSAISSVDSRSSSEPREPPPDASHSHDASPPRIVSAVTSTVVHMSCERDSHHAHHLSPEVEVETDTTTMATIAVDNNNARLCTGPDEDAEEELQAESDANVSHAATVDALHRLADLHQQLVATRLSLHLQYLNFAKFTADLGCALPMALNVAKEWDGVVQATGFTSGLIGLYKLAITIKPVS